MSWKETLEFLKSVPGWMLCVAVVGVVLLVAIQMVRGDALICGDGAFFAKRCDPITVTDLPTGAVVAFSDEEGCPTGWGEYYDAKGRFIVGAGQHSLNNEYGTPVPIKLLGEKGGQDQVKLEINHMPKHKHENPSKGADGGKYVNALQATGRGEYGGFHARPTQYTGGNQPHNNMPPYVALRYCKKE